MIEKQHSKEDADAVQQNRGRQVEGIKVGAIVVTNADSPYSARPMMYIFFLPCISPSLPPRMQSPA